MAVGHRTACAQIRDGGVDPWNLGKGEWLFYMSNATNKLGNSVSSVTNESSLMQYLKGQGVRYIIVKAATSDQLFNGSNSAPQFTKRLVDIAHTNGMLIFGYNRSWGSNIVGEIAIADYVFNQGADGFVFDAEAEWESDKAWIGNMGRAKAWQLCSTVRSNWPTKFLAHAPFPIISFHTSFPYNEFGYWCDAVMPQIYHFSSQPNLKKSMSAAINWTDVNWDRYHRSLIGSNSVINGEVIYWTNAIKPLAPINDVYGVGNNSKVAPTLAKDVMEFIDYLASDPNAVTPGGYKGVSLFRADLHDTAQWGHIRTCTLGDFPDVVSNIVMDDPVATRSGAWTPVPVFFNNTYLAGTYDTNCFGTNYMKTGCGGVPGYAQFTPKILTRGTYDLYEWHPMVTNASTSTPITIQHAGGLTTVFANQQTNSGNWSSLGRFVFHEGTNGYIRVGAPQTGCSTVAVADAIKLVHVPTPTLSFGRSGTNIVLSWPSKDQGYSLEKASVMTNPPAWITVTNSPAVLSNRYVVTNSIGSGGAVFRLKGI